MGTLNQAWHKLWPPRRCLAGSRLNKNFSLEASPCWMPRYTFSTSLLNSSLHISFSESETWPNCSYATKWSFSMPKRTKSSPASLIIAAHAMMIVGARKTKYSNTKRKRERWNRSGAMGRPSTLRLCDYAGLGRNCSGVSLGAVLYSTIQKGPCFSCFCGKGFRFTW